MSKQRVLSDFTEAEPSQGDRLDAPGERLGGLTNQITRCASQHEKPRGQRTSVCQNSQYWEELRSSLHLIDNHYASEAAECSHRFVQPGKTLWLFQIEVAERARRNDLSRKSRLAALTRSEQRDNPTPFERTTDLGDRARARNHLIWNVIMKIEQRVFVFLGL